MANIDERAVKLHSIGNMLAAENKVNEAIDHFKKAIAITPKYDAAIYHLAEAYEAKKLDSEALKFYNEAIELNESYAMIHIDAGLDSLLSGPLGKAVALYKKKHALDKHHEEEEPAEAETQMADQSVGEPDLGKAKAGVKPKKFVIEAAGNLESVVETCDLVKVRVMGERDLPVLGAAVTFNIVLEDTKLADSGLGLSRAQAGADPKHRLTIDTDGSGAATVYFKRSKHAGTNYLSVNVPGLAEQKIDDMTIAADVSAISIEPARSVFIAADRVSYTIKATDKHSNPVAKRELHVNLLMRETADWFAHNTAVLMTDEAGTVKYDVTMPTKSGVRCKLQAINKEADFKEEIEFALISGKIGSTLYIPMKGKVEAGKTFALKVKLLDEHDNAVIGKKAKIFALGQSAEKWKISAQDGAETGEDGSVFVIITPPAGVGEAGEFSIEADGLDPARAGKASFETVAEGKSDTVHTAMPAPGGKPAAAAAPAMGGFPDDDDLDMIPTAGAFKAPSPVAKPAGEKPAAAPAAAMNLGLDTLDFDSDSQFGGTGAFGDSGARTGGGFEDAFAAPSGQAGSAFDQLGAALEVDAGPQPGAFADFGAAPAAPSAPATAPAFAPGGGVKDVSLEKDSFDCEVGDSIQLSVVVLDSAGEYVTKGASATFTITEEPGKRDRDACFVSPDGTPTGDKIYKAQSDGSRRLTATVQASTEPGRIKVSLTCCGMQREAVIDVRAAAADKIVVTADELKLDVGAGTDLLAKVTDRFGNPLEGETVTFVVKEAYGRGGAIEEPSVTRTDNAGEARGRYISDGNGGDRTIVGVEHESVLSKAIKCVTIETLAPPEEEEGGEGEDAGGGFGAHTGAGFEDAFAPAAGQQAAFNPAVSFPTDAPGAKPAPAARPAAPAQAPAQQFAAPQQPPQFKPAFQAPAPAARPAADPVWNNPPQPAPQQGGFQAPFAPPAQAQGRVEYMSDELPVPQSTQDAYGQAAGGDDFTADGPSTEELIEMLDPYAPPKFTVKRGKKPSMELSELLTKVGLALAILASIGGIVYFGFVFSKTVRFRINLSKGNDLYSQNRFDDAITYFENCTKLDADKAEPYLKMGDIYLEKAEDAGGAGDAGRRNGFLNMAATNLNMAVSLDPNNADAPFELGRVYRLKGDKKKAIEMFNRTLTIDPKYGSALTYKKELEGDTR